MDIRISENPSTLHEIEDQWKKLILDLEKQFGDGLDLQAVLMLIGVQELGKGYRKFNKDQKLEVLHIAICTLLEPYGYYKFEGQDEDGYPHWSTVENLPPLKPGQQAFLMKQSILDYFADYSSVTEQ
jgi:hypothetical protein